MKKKIIYLSLILISVFAFKINANASSFIPIDFTTATTSSHIPDEGGTFDFHLNGNLYYSYLGSKYGRFDRLYARFTINSKVVVKNSYIYFVGSISKEFETKGAFIVSDVSLASNYYACDTNFSNSQDNNLQAFTISCFIDELDLSTISSGVITFFNTYNYNTSGTTYTFYFNKNIFLANNPSSTTQLESAIDKLEQTTIQEANETQEKLDETNQQLSDLNDNITSTDVSDSSDSANSFFSGFESDDHGLTSIITAPLNFIKSITSSTCNSIGFEAPFVHQQVTLPCMSSIYQQYFGNFLTIYQTITFGMISYWVCVNVFSIVKGFKDPDSDRIEVVDL